ncbi:hypothetical protein V1477_008831 [Vespula maculifrons]|uniref:Uncharacterized protein n=1 Tax=Vespula maculifrons TaxID=7453 RepID=A0ABD2CE50_VESMC
MGEYSHVAKRGERVNQCCKEVPTGRKHNGTWRMVRGECYLHDNSNCYTEHQNFHGSVATNLPRETPQQQVEEEEEEVEEEVEMEEKQESAKALSTDKETESDVRVKIKVLIFLSTRRTGFTSPQTVDGTSKEGSMDPLGTYFLSDKASRLSCLSNRVEA